jgi:hypothetical protein
MDSQNVVRPSSTRSFGCFEEVALSVDSVDAWMDYRIAGSDASPCSAAVLAGQPAATPVKSAGPDCAGSSGLMRFARPARTTVPGHPDVIRQDRIALE